MVTSPYAELKCEKLAFAQQIGNTEILFSDHTSSLPPLPLSHQGFGPFASSLATRSPPSSQPVSPARAQGVHSNSVQSDLGLPEPCSLCRFTALGQPPACCAEHRPQTLLPGATRGPGLEPSPLPCCQVFHPFLLESLLCFPRSVLFQ